MVIFSRNPTISGRIYSDSRVNESSSLLSLIVGTSEFHLMKDGRDFVKILNRHASTAPAVKHAVLWWLRRLIGRATVSAFIRKHHLHISSFSSGRRPMLTYKSSASCPVVPESLRNCAHLDTLFQGISTSFRQVDPRLAPSAPASSPPAPRAGHGDGVRGNGKDSVVLCSILEDIF